MTKLTLIEYHLKKLKYFKQINKEFRNTDNYLKMGAYKEIYDKAVTKYRKQIAFHRDAIETLERMNE